MLYKIGCFNKIRNGRSINFSHVTNNTEKLKSRLNRRLQKLARWGDKPVDDRQPAEMRMQLRNNIQMPLKSSFGGLINLPAPVSYSMHSQLAAANSTITSTRSQPTNLYPTSTSSNQLSALSSSSLSVVSSAPSSSFIASDKRDGPNQQRGDTEFSHEVLSDTTPARLIQPHFSSLHGQLTAASATGASSSGTTISNSGSGLSMLGAMGGTGLSMGGMKMDLDAIRALQMQSVKELSEALKGGDRQPSPSGPPTTSAPPTATAPADVSSQVLLDGDLIIKSDVINNADARAAEDNSTA